MKGIGPRAMAVAIGVLATATLSHAQSYPSSPIMLVNPYAAGGPADVLSPIAEASGRASASAGPPAAYGLTSMIGLDG